ncbi:cytochrome P450 4d2-like [Culicoides brevitarsis]|uniref:cytochrome P450 4d2-like n=1 Tax=Culicoides brevitarsis TaxID=469753 RepID=UPI00307B70F7
MIFYALLLLIPVFLYFLHQKRLEQDAAVGAPGPKGLPLFGCIFESQSYLKSQTMFKYFDKLHKSYGDTYQLWMGPTKMIISRDPKITEAIVNNPKFGKSSEYDLVKPWLGDSMLINEGEKWHKKRKMITPAFHFQILERFIPIFEEQSEVFIENLRDTMHKPEGIDIFRKLHLMTLDIISETSMGVQLKAQQDPHSPFIEANERMTKIIDKRVYSGYLAIEWLFRLSSLYKQQVESLKFINDYVDNVIVQRQQKLVEENKNKANSVEDSETKKRPALLDILLQAKIDGEPLSNDDIQAEVKTFMLAGHETTANSLSFTTYLLAKYPEVQEKLWNEIKSNNLDVKSDPLTIRDLNSLSYMDNVIKESLRIFPVATIVMKRCNEDVRIGNLFIPAKTSIATNIFSGHRMEKYFKDAEKFDPDRFNPEITAQDRNPYAYQPFSSGLRNCVGQKFALLEMKTVLVKLLTTFKLELADKDFEVDLIQMGTLRSKNGAPLLFKERN